jgi:hypothetical protein
MTRAARIAAIAAYSALGVTLVASRAIGLDHGFWTDEIVTARDVVRGGPRAIFAGKAVNHELFSLLAWATTSLAGNSEAVYRIWSVVPFVVGVAVGSAWVHIRVSPLAGILFAYLATLSPLLLDISRGARGYGIAFLAMTVMIAAALDARRTGRNMALAAMCAAGTVGTLTLPQFGLAFVATSAVLLADGHLRKRVAVALAITLPVIAAWYLPQIVRIEGAAHVEDGTQIDPAWVLTAPADLFLIPSLIWIDGFVLDPRIAWLLPILAIALIVWSSPLARDRRSFLVLIAGVAATIFVLFATRAFVVPRYVSFLLVPLYILLATGMASALSSVRNVRTIATALTSILVLAVVALRFATIAPDVMRYPREAHREAARAIAGYAPPRSPVFAYLHNPSDLAYYLDRPVAALEHEDVVAAVCGNDITVAYVMQPFAVAPVDVPCLDRTSTRHFRFRQYTRGDEMNVWIVPPR